MTPMSERLCLNLITNPKKEQIPSERDWEVAAKIKEPETKVIKAHQALSKESWLAVPIFNEKKYLNPANFRNPKSHEGKDQ